MIKRLSDYTGDQYHRPNDPWIDVPVRTVMENGEWKTFTVRKRSLRAKRRIFTISCTAFTIGLLMIVLSSPYSKEFLVPGPLSSNHAQLLAGEGADRCAACHAAGNGTLTNWIASTLLAGQAEGLTQSELCMKCHDDSLAADTALNPHNVAPIELAKISDKYEKASFDAGMVFQPPVIGHEMACSACHREHHGSRNDLTFMTDNQCQSCHQSSCSGFETDHPEFVSYPLKRRSRIAFDHASHSLNHFPSKQTEFNCNQCHIDDSFQNVKKLASYEQACSGCHHQQILDSGQDGLALIALPMLDTEAIESAQLKIGSWPLAATGDFDGKIPPIMRVMLSADPQASEILSRFGPDFDFADLDPANRAHVDDAVELVWAIKRLLYDLSLDGPRAVRTRLESVMGLEVTDQELQKMVTNLDEPVFQNAVKRWLPNLTAEVANHSFAIPDHTILNKTALNDIKLKRSELSWWPSDETMLMRIAKQDELLAPNPLAGLVAPLGAAGSENEIPIVRVPDVAEVKIGKPQQPQTALSKPVVLSDKIRNAHADPLLSNPDLLAVNPLQSNNQPTNEKARPADQTQIRVPEKPQPGRINVTESNRKPRAAPSRNVPVGPNKFAKTDRSPIVVPSGWFRDDLLFRISYRPSGHADQCVQSWIELVTRAADANTRPETKQLFQKTISMTSIGLCRSCHTVDQLPDRSFQVNWRAEYRDPSIRSFTRFAHGPHLVQPGLRDCSHCHTIDSQSSNHESFHGVDSTEVVSNFLPIKISNCSSCHQENQTSNSCTQCHNYHVGSRVSGSK